MNLIITEANEIEVTGSVKSVQDYSMVKDAIESKIKEGDEEVTLVLKGVESLTSSVISYLIKVVHSKNIKLSLQVESPRLMELLDQLNLTGTFRITRI
jgi:anti-anti-sigma regulatory factor